MLSMSVEHANQLRQLIVEKHRPQPAGLANIYILRSLSTIASVPLDNPKSFPFICQLASTHTKKIDFMRQPVPVTLLPLDISSVLARAAKVQRNQFLVQLSHILLSN